MLGAVREIPEIKMPIWVFKRKKKEGRGDTKLPAVLVEEQWKLLLLGNHPEKQRQ